MPRLLISAAHTLENPGEIYGELREADLTRNIVQKVLPHLNRLGIEYQPVPLDLALLKRIEWINNTGYTKEQGDIMVEIHVNDGGKRGIEGWYEGTDNPDNFSKKLTESLVESIAKDNNVPNQGVKSEHQHELGSLIILNQTNTISTAIECLYIDNPQDIEILKDETKLETLAISIANAINKYLKEVAPKLDYKKIPAKTDFLNNQIGENNNFNNIDPFTGFSTTPPMLNMGPSMPTSIPQAKSEAPIMMDRKAREEMIKNRYLQILGEEPESSELNLNLNLGVNENDLIKKLIEDAKHKELVDNAKAYKELKKDYDKIKSQLDSTEINLKDARSIQDSLYKIIEQKNKLIVRMQQELVGQNIIKKGSHIDSNYPQEQRNTYSAPPVANIKKKKTFTEFIMQIFKL